MSNKESVHLADSTLTTGYEPKLKLNLKKKSIFEDSDATPIEDPNLDDFSDFSRVTRCVGSSVSHVSRDEGVFPEKNQLREIESSHSLFPQVSCVDKNVLGGRNPLRETGCRQREREKKDKIQVL